MKSPNSKKGFTLIELLVVITIFGLIMLTAFYTLGRASQQVKLQMSVEQVASNLRFDQTEVKSGFLSPNGNQICRGYTFEENKNSYVPVWSNYAAGQCSNTLNVSSALSHASGVELQSIVPLNSLPIHVLTVLFQPPTGSVQFFDGSGVSLGNNLGFGSVDLTFAYTLSDYPNDGILTINKSGQLNFRYQ
ncbi:MAG: type II secretion system protein [Candidatus Peregrinibacteria bacterium]|nr:type II secretion system protein [Candidatus Peregrinibacteria bacterium]